MKSFCTIIAILAFSPVCLAQDLDEAKAVHKEAVEAARKKVLLKWQELIQAEIKKNNLDTAAAYGEFRNHFETEDAVRIPDGAEEMVPVFKEYGTSIKEAADTLRAAYLAEIDSLIMEEDAETAAALTTELADLRLPSKLISFQPMRKKGYLGHAGMALQVNSPQSNGARLTSTFEMTAGLSKGEFTSIRSINWPNKYLDHSGYRVRLTTARDDPGWKAHATWIKVAGLADDRNGISFQSASHPDRYIRIRSNGEAWLDKFDDTAQFKVDATFYGKEPVFKLWQHAERQKARPLPARGQ